MNNVLLDVLDVDQASIEPGEQPQDDCSVATKQLVPNANKGKG